MAEKLSWLSVTESEGKLNLTSPYCPAAIASLKSIGGRWIPETEGWEFNPRERERLGQIIYENWGVDLTRIGEIVDLEVKLTPEDYLGFQWHLMGRPILRRYKPNRAVLPQDYVTLHAGAFTPNNISGNIGNPLRDTRLVIREVPVTALPLVEKRFISRVLPHVVGADAPKTKRKPKGKDVEDFIGTEDMSSILRDSDVIRTDDTSRTNMEVSLQYAHILKPYVAVLTNKERDEIFKIIFE